MHFDAVQRILGLLLMLFSFTMLPPALMALMAGDGTTEAFLAAFAIILGIGLLLWLPVHRSRRELRTRDGFFIVAMFWLVLSLSGAVPLTLAKAPHLSFTDAVFESVSGLTTTGATVISGLDYLPLSVRFYRQQLQWLGGMGIIVLAVAVLPMLGIGGMQLYRAETPGPVKDAKLTPRITETAKVFWYLYLGLTVACGLAFWLAGMDAFDAIGHAFATLSTGGFSTHDANLAYFNSPLIEMVAVVFMFAGGANFSLHFVAWRYRTFRPYATDGEFRLYAVALTAASALIGITLFLAGAYPAGDAFRHALFQVVSFTTTTGFVTAGYPDWPTYVPLLLMFLCAIGGCASSTSGGIKLMRVLLLFKQGAREIKRLIHPQAQILVKFGDQEVGDRVIDAVWGFFATYIAVFVILLLLLMAFGLDQVTAFSTLASCMGNAGPALGKAAANFAELDAASKWVLSIAMIMGRLEIFTLLVLFTPAFWRR